MLFRSRLPGCPRPHSVAAIKEIDSDSRRSLPVRTLAAPGPGSGSRGRPRTTGGPGLDSRAIAPPPPPGAGPRARRRPQTAPGPKPGPPHRVAPRRDSRRRTRTRAPEGSPTRRTAVTAPAKAIWRAIHSPPPGQPWPKYSPVASARGSGVFGITSNILALPSRSPPGPAGGASDGYGLGRGAAGPGRLSTTTAAGALRVIV